MSTHILLVEDEASIAQPLEYLLQAEGFTVSTIGNGTEAIENFAEVAADLVLLDLMLPGTPGTEVCRQIRAQSTVPIIMLTAKGSEIDKVVGLELGADDYVTKPYSARELMARIKSLLRRVRDTTADALDALAASQDDEDVLVAGHIELNVDRHTVTVDGEELTLPLKEFELLELLMRNQGRVLTRTQLISLIWGNDYVGDTRTLDVHIKRLRRRLENGPDGPRLITTVRGVGYRFD